MVNFGVNIYVIDLVGVGVVSSEFQIVSSRF